MAAATSPLPRVAAVASRSVLRRVVSVLALVLIVAGLCLAWPTVLGGKTAFVITQGDSMLPGYRSGGLVVTRAQQHYDVGDVVAYRDATLDAVILHRVVGIDDERLVMQGDNNDFLDPTQPAPQEILGAKWTHLPKVGGFLQRLRDPVMFAVIVAGIGLLSIKAQPTNVRRRRRRAG